MPTFPITFRQNFAATHDQMDPWEDRAEIFETLFTREFPVEFLLSAEIAQLRTFTFPNGTALLHRTGEFEKHSLKRLDDTRAILVELGRDGFDSPRAESMASHLNEIHGFYNIPNEEFLHTLSTFIFDVILFVDEYGYRRFTEVEKEAIFHVYVKMGQLMNIEEIPESLDAFWKWRLNYEAEKQAYAETNHQVAEGLMNGARQMVPAILRPFVLPFVLSIEERKYSELLGYRYPNVVVRGFFKSIMWMRKRFNKVFTLWDVLSFEEMLLSNFQTYPNGYNPMLLGPTKLVQQIKKRRADKTAKEAAESPAVNP